MQRQRRGDLRQSQRYVALTEQIEHRKSTI
jgi:hypothetical protein